MQQNLRMLQAAMLSGGFFGLRTEWWHFTDYDWKKYAPMREAKQISD
ncbi:MAG: M15 family metallopeptidase [Terriglobia bacterium]